MDLSAYLLDSVVRATTPQGETATDAQSRIDAITEMLRAYQPATHLEAMIACQCIMMQFLFNAAMRDTGNPRLDPAGLARARAEANAASRTLHQWVSKFEKERKRNETRAAEAAKAQAAQAKPKPAEQPSLDKPAQPPAPAAAVRPAAQLAVPDGPILGGSEGSEPPCAAAPIARSAAAGLGASGLKPSPAAAQSARTKIPVAA